MRIIGEFEKEGIKVTVFSMNERTSVKFEYNLMEQTYKFRDGSSVSSYDDVQTFCSEKTLQQIHKVFMEMGKTRTTALMDMQAEVNEHFDEII